MHTRVARLAALLLATLSPARAFASFLPPEMMDKAADIVAIVVLCFVPIAVIVVFWLVHVLPEKIAEKRHHPQKEAITTLCLLSLVFGGMLWPLAWIWAYTRPVLHRAAYGTDLHEDYFVEMLDKAADIVAIVVLCIVPIVVIVIFWLVHVLPEKIAHKRHHPQLEAITTLCLLSLVFGGMLWPIAWLWAYTKPVAHRAAYGTDKHDDYFVEMGEKARSGSLLREEIAHLRQELDEMAARGALPPALQKLRGELDSLHALAEQRAAVTPAPPPAPAAAPAPAPAKKG